MRVVFFGTPEFAATVLEGLLDSPHEVACAVAAPDRPSGRGRKVRRGAVSALARERGIGLFQPASLRDAEVQERLRSFDADCFAVASYGLILPTAVLDIPKLARRGGPAVVNAHASLLPELRGAAPVERAILAGLAVTGVSIQRMVREVDAGDVYASRETEIGARENAGSLRKRLAAIAAELLPEVLSGVESGTARAEPQDASRVTLAPPLAPDERAVRWAEPAAMIDRRVRAFAPRPGAFALLPDELGGKRLKVLEAEPEERDQPQRGQKDEGGRLKDEEGRPHPSSFRLHPPSSVPSVAKPLPGDVLVASDREGLVVAAGEGAVRLVTVQPEGARAMDAGAFLRGHAMRPGMRLRDGVGTQGAR